MKQNNIVNDLLAEEISKNDEIKNHKQYIEDLNIDQEDFEIILNIRICFHPPCLNKIIGSNNYCNIHQDKKSVIFKNPYKNKNLYIVYIMSSKKITKLNEYFYMTQEGEILKYKKYCIINNCKRLSSYNYSGKKEILYCNDHKLDKMVNIRKGYSFCEKKYFLSKIL